MPFIFLNDSFIWLVVFNVRCALARQWKLSYMRIQTLFTHHRATPCPTCQEIEISTDWVFGAMFYVPQ
jgi:hypothetical protein